METASTPSRIGFIDIARFYAMVLVFYGHFIEEFMLLKNPAGAAQYKFIYSFHMVLFIVLAGYIVREHESEWGIGRFLKHRFFSRLLPYLFFTLAMTVPPIFFSGKFFGLALPSTQGYAIALTNTVFGLPTLCIPSWFLMLIIGVELVHYGVFRFIRQSNIAILAAAAVFYIAGYYLNLTLDIFNPLKGRIVWWNYFFIHEAVTLYAFYLIGIYLRRQTFLLRRIPTKWLAPGAVAALLLVNFTYALNTGPFNFHVYNYVVILFASHGHVLLFPLTAAAGCLLILLVARMSPQPKLFAWLGQNTLILMCLNGIFYHYINPDLAKWALARFSSSALSVTLIGIVVTTTSLALCIPLVYLLNRYVPQLVGKPRLNGPLLPRLLTSSIETAPADSGNINPPQAMDTRI